MSWYVGYSLNQLLAEINTSAPNRNKASDGSIGDQAHQGRTSDHNPCACHTAVCARDFTHDPTNGFDSYAFANWLRERCQSGTERRVKYIISNARIASPTNNWAWRGYTGSNPHSRHVHVSVSHGPEKFNDKASWGYSGGTVTPPPSTGGTFTLELQKNELTPAKQAELRGNGDVYLVQQIAQGHFKQLGKSAYDCGTPDGDYGPRTVEAVKQMQRDGGLTADGECGNNTWSYLLNKSGG